MLVGEDWFRLEGGYFSFPKKKRVKGGGGGGDSLQEGVFRHKLVDLHLERRRKVRRAVD